uniref:Uncharacterized protein n=1 Tax=Neogobius melanostomus TaxID=47308 RepID=A0A8C6WLJ6_9GOBI
MAERALAQELLSPEGGYNVSYLLHLARLQLHRGEYASAMANLEEALHQNDENAEAWALKGHCYLLQGDLCRARESYECSLSFQPPPADPHLVLLRLGSICQEAGQLGELSLAESALTEANHLNSRNARVWIYLSFICLKVSRQGLKAFIVPVVECANKHIQEPG